MSDILSSYVIWILHKLASAIDEGNSLVFYEYPKRIRNEASPMQKPSKDTTDLLQGQKFWRIHSSFSIVRIELEEFRLFYLHILIASETWRQIRGIYIRSYIKENVILWSRSHIPTFFICTMLCSGNRDYMFSCMSNEGIYIFTYKCT